MHIGNTLMEVLRIDVDGSLLGFEIMGDYDGPTYIFNQPRFETLPLKFPVTNIRFPIRSTARRRSVLRLIHTGSASFFATWLPSASERGQCCSPDWGIMCSV